MLFDFMFFYLSNAKYEKDEPQQSLERAGAWMSKWVFCLSEQVRGVCKLTSEQVVS